MSVTAKLPDSRSPIVVAACLDWLSETLPAPRPPRDWRTMSRPGFSPPKGRASSDAWRKCEQCGGNGQTRRGPCPNCGAAGGWHYDPMDDAASDLRSAVAAHPERDAPAVRFVRLTSETTLERLEQERNVLAPTLQHIVEALDLLRVESRPQRAAIQVVHIIRLLPVDALRPAERDFYDDGLERLAQLLPSRFRAPRHIRERALRR